MGTLRRCHNPGPMRRIEFFNNSNNRGSDGSHKSGRGANFEANSCGLSGADKRIKILGYTRRSIMRGPVLRIVVSGLDKHRPKVIVATIV